MSVQNRQKRHPWPLDIGGRHINGKMHQPKFQAGACKARERGFPPLGDLLGQALVALHVVSYMLDLPQDRPTVHSEFRFNHCPDPFLVKRAKLMYFQQPLMMSFRHTRILYFRHTQSGE